MSPCLLPWRWRPANHLTRMSNCSVGHGRVGRVEAVRALVAVGAWALVIGAAQRKDTRVIVHFSAMNNARGPSPRCANAKWRAIAAALRASDKLSQVLLFVWYRRTRCRYNMVSAFRCGSFAINMGSAFRSTWFRVRV